MRISSALKGLVVAAVASPQGREALKRGARWVREPENQRKLAELRDKGLAKGREVQAKRSRRGP